MISKIIAFVRQVMYRMGLIKGIKNLSEHKDIAADEEHYKRIDMWYACTAATMKSGTGWPITQSMGRKQGVCTH